MCLRKLGFTFHLFFVSLNCSRYLGEWIEKVKERANELSQQIRHNDLQLQKLSEEKQEALEHFSCWSCFDKFVCVCATSCCFDMNHTRHLCLQIHIKFWHDGKEGIQVSV